jgi:CBS domain-containing membrane protein
MTDIDKLKVGEIMDRKLIAVSPTTTIRAAAKLISTTHVDTLPIIEDGKLTGIVYDDDILGYSVEHDEEEMASISIEQLVRPPIFLESGMSARQAIRLAAAKKATRIPVVDNKNSMHCIGMISSTELLREIVKADRFRKRNL